MTDHPLDNPEVTRHLFYPRKAIARTDNDDRIHDGTIMVDANTKLGYRLHLLNSSAPVLLYFHGNGEVATDYESIVPYFYAAGVSLLVVDYRGYGWSTGTPLTSRLLPDALRVLEQIEDVMKDSGVIPGRSLFLMGRSLGSAPAIYLAMTHPDKLKGLIIESGYADAPSLFGRLGIAIPEAVKDDPTLPLNNDVKIKQVTIPTLIIHGERDFLIPVTHGRTLYENAGSSQKQLVTIPNAGHNDVSFVDIERYFEAIKQFVEQHRT